MPVDADLTSVQQARDLVAASSAAQKIFATFSQEKVDKIVEVMARAALLDKERLAKIAVEETGYGVVKDKTEKNRFAAEDVHNFFRGLKTVGVINERDNIIEIADPRGVVAAIIPSTNPTSTAIFKILISVKSRNGVVLSPHPSAARCINETTRIMRDAAEAAGMPKGLVGCLAISTLQATEELMKHKLTAVILATGGIGLVRAAYSSGKPAFGVGPGNVPVLIESSAEIDKAVSDILASKTFDYGTICASEQAVVVEAAVDSRVKAAFIAQGARFCDPDEIAKLEKLMVLPTRGLNPKVVGKSPQVIAQMAGFSIPADTRALIVELKGVGRDHPLSMEKLSPVLAYYTVDNWQIGSELCHEILRFGGMGHTIGIHSNNRDIIRQFGLRQPASRIIVNSPTTHGAIGLSTGLSPSMTLGCGSWGGNVTSDNVSPVHLMDIKRVAFETRPVSSVSRVSSVLASAASSTVDLVTKGLITQIASEVINHSKSQDSGSHSHGSSVAESPSAGLNDSAITELVEQFLSQRRAKRVKAASTTTTVTSKVEEQKQAAVEEPKKEALEEPKKADKKVEAVEAEKVKKAEKVEIVNSRPYDFVCEDDVRLALKNRQKIYVTAKTIITPSARDLGESNEVFAKV
ncbi:MAG: aldehyde dehydrogenase family protein [Blastocatellia bacterium]|nr:aldehyde dehydrogenase family protein [Blastocatellia bacterium]